MRRYVLVLLAVVLVACGGDGARNAKTPRTSGVLPERVSTAFKEEAAGDFPKAVQSFAEVVQIAASAPDDPYAVPAALAALDALVHRDVYAFADVATSSALADRVDAASRKKLDDALAAAEKDADGPFVRGLVANARLALAERRGDVAAATDLRARTGCAREAVLVGPVSWFTVSGVREEDALASANAPLPAEIPGPGPFSARLRPLRVASLGCHIPLYAQASVPGVRDVIVDVDVPRAGTIGVALRARSAATLRAGGRIVLERPYSVGAGSVPRFARVDVDKAGSLRLVARVGMEQDFATIEIDAWDDAGKPLRLRAPSAGQAATVAAKNAAPVVAPAPKTDAELLTVALADLAANESRTAENLLHVHSSREGAPPELLLAYARAVRGARDLPAVKAQERGRAALDRALEAWPESWEATIEHSVLAGQRRGHAEANLEALADLEKSRPKSKTRAREMLDAYEAAVAGREHLYDRARDAFERAAGRREPKPGGSPLLGSALLRDVERIAFERTGREAAAFDCDQASPSDRTGLACHHALEAAGDRAGAEKELERLRALSGSPQLYLSLSSRSALEVGDIPRAAKLLDAMNPGDRPLSTIYAVKGKTAVPELVKQATIARDGPSALPSLLRAAGDDPLTLFDGVAERVVNDKEAGALLANAATAILAHDERYTIDESGLVRFVMLDVRRVMGTTDVEANAQASAPMVFGRDSVRVLRRRIFKKDGRIVLPDRTPNAAQSHADLSQLEAGDAVEAIYEGTGVPGEIGNVGIDTPDLMPERTAVRDAKIELTIPQGLRGSLWSHPILGKPEEKVTPGKKVLTWRVKDRGVRRIEAGVPKMDRSVMVSFSTTTWEDVARGQRETLAALDADSPEVSAWARTASKNEKGRALVDAIVAASGQAVKEASGVVLADVDIGRSPGGQAITARHILATHEGSRTWLIVRALRELGVPTDVAVAENEPFSDSPSFPPHFGRFMHPLAIAHVDGKDVWIDADVSGPPLPAGRISPELRGRNALMPDGRIAPLPSAAADGERDEIDIRLTVDEQGNAKGLLTVLLRGRAAQDVSEALFRLVGLERQRALRGIALAWVPFATVEKVELSSTEGSWQVAIRAELTAPAYAQVEGTKPGSRTWILPGIDPIHYVFPRPFVTTLSSVYATQGARESALAINHATQYHVRRKVELPAKAQIARLPGPFDGKGPLLAAQRKISVAGTSIEEDFTLEVSTGTVPRERYDAFVAETHRTDDAFRASTRVKPPVP